MNSHRHLFIVTIILGVMMLVGWFVAFKSVTLKKTAPAQPVVAASVYPLYDLVRNIISPDQSVILLLPPGNSPDTQLSEPITIQSLTGVDLLFVIGHGLDSWVVENATQANVDQIVTVDKGVAIFDDNPYYWLSLDNTKLIVRTIADTLGEKDPTNLSSYQTRADGYLAKLDQLREYGMQEKTKSAIKEFQIPSPAWNYLARDFNLTASVSASQSGILLSLDPIGGSIDKDTYLSLMKANIDGVFNQSTD